MATISVKNQLNAFGFVFPYGTRTLGCGCVITGTQLLGASDGIVRNMCDHHFFKVEWASQKNDIGDMPLQRLESITALRPQFLEMLFEILDDIRTFDSDDPDKLSVSVEIFVFPTLTVTMPSQPNDKSWTDWGGTFTFTFNEFRTSWMDETKRMKLMRWLLAKAMPQPGVPGIQVSVEDGNALVSADEAWKLLPEHSFKPESGRTIRVPLMCGCEISFRAEGMKRWAEIRPCVHHALRHFENRLVLENGKPAYFMCGAPLKDGEAPCNRTQVDSNKHMTDPRQCKYCNICPFGKIPARLTQDGRPRMVTNTQSGRPHTEEAPSIFRPLPLVMTHRS